MFMAAVMTACVYSFAHAEAIYTLKIVNGPDDSQGAIALAIGENDIRGHRLRKMDDGRERLDILLTRGASRSLKKFTSSNLDRKMTFYWKERKLGSALIKRVIRNGIISLMVSNWDVHEMKTDLQKRGLLEPEP